MTPHPHERAAPARSAARAENGEETTLHIRVLNALDHIPTGLAVQDEHGGFLFANRVFRDLHGGSATLLHHHSEHHANAWRHASGRWLMIHKTPVADGQTVAIYTDITDLKAGEEELRHAKTQAESTAQARSEFLASMSHELRTPLNAIIGFSDTMLNQVFGPLGNARYQEYARDILNSGKYLLSLVNDLQDLSRIEAGAMVAEQHPVALGEVVERALSMTRDSALANGLTLDVDIPADLPAARGDERRLLQVMLNLLSNAVKFTPEGGIVAISATADDQGLIVRVADTGIGIAEEDIPLALEAFGQIESSQSRRFPGSGLGLPLSRKLVELIGGSLTIESAVGTGTTVIVRLPVAGE